MLYIFFVIVNKPHEKHQNNSKLILLPCVASVHQARNLFFFPFFVLHRYFWSKNDFKCITEPWVASYLQ